MAAPICIELPSIPDKYVLSLPGLGEMAYLRDTLEQMPRPSSMLLKFLNGLSPALAPVNSVIKMVDMIQAIVSCISAVPKCFVQLNPGPLVKCLQKLFQAFGALMSLIPPMPYIRMVVDIVVLIRLLIDDLLSLFSIIDAEISSIKAVLAKGQQFNNSQLIEIGECARRNLNKEMGGLMQIVEIIGKFMGLIFTIMDAIASLIPGADEKVAEWRAAFGDMGGFDDQGAASFVAIQPIYTMLSAMRNILIVIEQFGRAICGLPFQMPTFTAITLQNA